MAKKQLIYETVSDFYLGGTYIPAGATVVQGHELMKGRKHLFKPFVPTFGSLEGAELPEVEQPPETSAKPAEKAQAAEDQKAMTEDGGGAKAKANADGSFQKGEG